MVQTASTMLPLGTTVPAFSLTDVVTGTTVSPEDFADRAALLVMFICNHCPFVKHVKTELGRVAKDYQPKGVGIVAINSNDVANYPEDAPANMKALVRAEGWQFPFCHDETQAVAQAFHAACTPDFYVFDGDRALVYRGQLDDSRPKTGVRVTGKDLRRALDAVLAGTPVPADQKPSIGCNIKWKKGNEPAYFGA